MVDVIVRSTVLAVLALAALNALHAGVVLVRFVRHLRRRHPHSGVTLWLPAFTSPADIQAWLGRWREAVGSREPALCAIRAEARTVIGRHLYLALLSHTWALAVT
ncbi:MAG TPA: hypothetical protein VFV05_19655, partial [Methylomirabilota bacterium]|nr:hypothetical protein [Methylomirabilota bacterium]